MSYTTTIRPVVGSRARTYRRVKKLRKPPALGGFISELIDIVSPPGVGALINLDTGTNDYTAELGCLSTSNAQVQDLDAKINNLATVWQPTGYYSADDVNKVVSIVVQQIQGAKVQVLVAPAATSDQVDTRNQALDDLDKQFANATRFSQAATLAASTSSIVNAPDLKDWVLDGLLAASNGYVFAAVMGCRNDLIGSAEAAYDAVWNVVSTVVNAVVSAAETVVNVAAGAFDAAAFLSKYSEYIILGGGALAVYWYFFRGK